MRADTVSQRGIGVVTHRSDVSALATLPLSLIPYCIYPIPYARSRSFRLVSNQGNRSPCCADSRRRLPDVRLVVQRLCEHYPYSYWHHRRDLGCWMDTIQPRIFRWGAVIVAGVSRDGIVSIAVISITVAVFAWYQTGLTEIQRWTNTTIVLLVSVLVATGTTIVLKKWNPRWYRS